MADGDSPLSTTSNIIGLLTFALAVFSFCLAFYAATADAPGELRSYRDYLSQRGGHITEIHKFFDERDIIADNELEGTDLKALLVSSVKLADKRRQELERNVSDICEGEEMSVNKRLRWWRKRRDLSMAMSKVEIQMHYLTALQMSFLLRKINRQSMQLDRVEKSVSRS